MCTLQVQLWLFVLRTTLKQGKTASDRNIGFIFPFPYGSTALYEPGPPRFVEVSRSHTFRHTTVGRTLDEGPARRRDLYLTTHNTHNRQTSMPSVGFEPTVPVSERPQTHALGRTATGIGCGNYLPVETE
jgi:hypothetical protein